MPRTHRTASCTPDAAKKRAAIAMAYLEAAHCILEERSELKEEHLSVAAGNAPCGNRSIGCHLLQASEEGPPG